MVVFYNLKIVKGSISRYNVYPEKNVFAANILCITWPLLKIFSSSQILCPVERKGHVTEE